MYGHPSAQPHKQSHAHSVLFKRRCGTNGFEVMPEHGLTHPFDLTLNPHCDIAAEC